MKPLEGIKVVEMGTHVAAPTCARMMADWGADVIKVENTKGEAYRTVGLSWLLPVAEDNNPILQPGNCNKRSISINLKDPAGKEILFRLLEDADVFLTNTRPQALVKLGLDYDSLKDRFPKLIYALFTAYGLNGPDKDAPGFDTAAYWGRGGMLTDWNPKEMTPGRPHPGFGDATVGAAMLAAISSCLFRRTKTGEGDFVTSSLYGAAVWYNHHGVVEAQYPGHDNPISRYDAPRPLTPVYKSADGKVFYIIEQAYDEKAPEFFKRLGLDKLANDPLFVNCVESRKNMKFVVDTLDEEFAKINYDDIDQVCKDLNMVHSYIGTSKEILSDPQAWENNYLRKITLENGDELIVPNTPVQFGSVKEMPVKLAPHLGIDTRDIMRGLGYTDEQISEMAAAGTINTHGN